MQTIHTALPDGLGTQFDTADRLAPLMTTASQIGGNPRLIKRFLNALSIRMAISNAQGVGVDEAVLAKMLLFERCAAPAAYDVLARAVNNDGEGKPRFLANWEEKALAGEKLDLKEPWDEPFITEWLTVPPRLADIDLRGVLYVSREHAPLITPEDRLSSEGADLLAAILEQPDMAGELHDRLTRLPGPKRRLSWTGYSNAPVRSRNGVRPPSSKLVWPSPLPIRPKERALPLFSASALPRRSNRASFLASVASHGRRNCWTRGMPPMLPDR